MEVKIWLTTRLIDGSESLGASFMLKDSISANSAATFLVELRIVSCVRHSCIQYLPNR